MKLPLVATILGPESSVAVAPGVKWWICKCGRKLCEHSQRTVPNTGGKEYVCAHNGRENSSGVWKMGRFEPADESLDYSYAGLVVRK